MYSFLERDAIPVSAHTRAGLSETGPNIAIRHRERRRQLARELLQLEEADAWFEYLESTAGRAEERYREVELSAWARLGERLRAVKARLSRLRPAAA